MPVQQGILGVDRLGEHPHRADVGLAQLGLHPLRLEHAADVIAEREEHLVGVLGEPAAPPRAHEHPVWPVAQVDGDREKVTEPVRRDLAVDRIRREGVAREALRERLARRVVVEPARGDHVEMPGRIRRAAR